VLATTSGTLSTKAPLSQRTVDASALGTRTLRGQRVAVQQALGRQQHVGLGQLREGCMFYVDRFQAADSPKMVDREVSCPTAIQSKSNLRASARSV